MKRFAAFLVSTIFSLPILSAQQTSFYGTVKDSSGAVIVNAKIQARNVSGGPLFTAITNNWGDYQLPAISAATYKLVSTASGFKLVARTITILVGQSLQADFVLGLSATSEQVEVSADAASLDVTTSQVAGVIDPGKMTELPLNGRNYLQLGTVVPGVRVNAVTSSLLTSWNVGGQQINLDGQQTLENSRYMAREAVPLFSRDAIAEFQVITNRFDATQGGSAQIILNLQSKSGSNSLHGSAFAYFRNDAFDAADPITKTVLAYNDRQYGGTVGGPVQKDRTYYFGSYEGERQPYTLVLTPYGFSSVYPTWTHPATNTVDEYLARFDHALRPQDHLSLRISAYKQYTPFVVPPAGGETNPTYLSDQRTNGYAPLLTWTATRGPNIVNDLKIGFNHTGQQLSPFFKTMTLAFPSTSIGGYYYDPDHSNSEKQSYRDDFYWLHGKHSFKLGAEYSYVPYHGAYNMYSRGVAVMSQDLTNLPAYFPNLFEESTWDLTSLSKYVSSYTQAFGTEQYKIPVQNVGLWIQDDWKATRQLTLNFGIRYDNNIGVWDPQAVLKSGLKQQEHGDNRDFGPRIGFAWSPGNSGQTVIRGGAGLYYANVPVNPIQDAVLFNGERTVLPTVTATTGSPVNLAAPYGSTTAAQILANPDAWKQTVQVMAASGLETPWNAEVSVGAQSELFKYFTASADYLHNRTHHMWMRSDTNLYYDATTGYNKNPSTYGRPNSTYASILTFVTPGNVGAIYDALLVSVQQKTGMD
jgi:hypothetical protein